MPIDTSTEGVGPILISGGASGLGRAVARAVDAAGGRPLILDRDEPREGFTHQIVDLADSAATEAAVSALIDAAGGLAGVVTAAAMDVPGAFAETDRLTWERIVQVNLLGTAAVIRAALPALRAGPGEGRQNGRRGKIVTVASTLGLRTLPAATAYSASKHGIVGLSRALALDLAGEVGVTMLVPGGMATAFFDGRAEAFKPAPDQLLNDPADVAEAVMFALRQPPGCEIRELLITPSVEPSWP